MRKLHHPILFLVLVFISLPGINRGQTFFRKHGSSNHDQYYAIAPSGNNFFVISGMTKAISSNGADGLITAVDTNGTMLWSKQTGGTQDENFIYIAPAGNNFIACGETFSTTNGRGDAVVAKLDNTGNILWSKIFGDTLYDIAYSCEMTSDGGYIVCGLTESLPLYNYDAFLLKLDASGNTQWQKRIGSPYIDHAVSVKQTNDGGYIFSGKSMAQSPGLSDVWLVRTNSTGDTLWSSLTGGNGWDEGMSVREYNSGFMVCGGSNSFGSADYDFYLMQTDSSGAPQWTKTYGGPHVEASYSLCPTPTGWIFAGYTETYGPGHNQRNGPSSNQPPVTLGTDSANAFVVRTDFNGDTIWCHSYGDVKKEECFSIVPRGNTGYMITGYTESFGSDSTDAYFVGIDANGNAGCHERPSHPTVSSQTSIYRRYPFTVSNTFQVDSMLAWTSVNAALTAQTLCAFSSIAENEATASMLVSPNPATDEINLQFSAYWSGKEIEIRITDMLGRTVFASNEKAGENMLIPCGNWAGGVYVIQAGANTFRQYQRILKAGR